MHARARELAIRRTGSDAPERAGRGLELGAWALLLFFGALTRHPRIPGGRRVLAAALRRATRASPPFPPSQGDRVALASVTRASRWLPFAPSCLPRALTLHWLLVRRGSAARVRLGLTQQRDRLVGHAWVELNGSPLGEDPVFLSRFAACETS